MTTTRPRNRGSNSGSSDTHPPTDPEQAPATPPPAPPGTSEAPRSPLFLDRETAGTVDEPSPWTSEGPDGLGSSAGYEDEDLVAGHASPYGDSSSIRSTGSAISRAELMEAAGAGVDTVTGFLARILTGTQEEAAAGLWLPTDRERETAAGALADLVGRRVPEQIRGSDFLDVAKLAVTGAVYLGRNLRQRWALRRAAAERMLAGVADVEHQDQDQEQPAPYYAPAPAAAAAP